MLSEERYTELKRLYDTGIRAVNFIYLDGSLDGKKIKGRLGMTTTGDIIIMKKGSNRRGYPIKYEDNLTDFVPIVSKKTDAQKWEHQLKRAISILDKSGLWTDLKGQLSIALYIGYDNMQKAKEIDEIYLKNVDYAENRKIKDKQLMQIDPRLVLLRELIRYAYPLKLKAMRFTANKEENNHKLAQLSQAVKNKTPISLSGRTSYDVSCQYDPLAGKIWYSEEFKNCGNGHYYLALDDKTAMFYEDD